MDKRSEGRLIEEKKDVWLAEVYLLLAISPREVHIDPCTGHKIGREVKD